MFKRVERQCRRCGKHFQAWTTQVYCSAECRKRDQKAIEPYHAEAPAGIPIIREFNCKQCGRTVFVWEKSDKRTVFCSHSCEVNYWKHGYLKDNNGKHNKSGNNMTSGMSLYSLIRRERMDEA